jgi:DNA (cytosine-5)-methyltransferase 1
MRELSLFTGAGGGLLGTKLLGWRNIGYVEINDYCQRVIRQRIADGMLEDAPIFGDIRAFISEGYAAGYQGLVDVVTAGFPCQPFSIAGKQAGEDDPRNMWPETIAVIRAVRPRFALLENTPGLLAHPYARRIFGDLAESGLDAGWRVLSAAELGAPHLRDRVWIVAYSDPDGFQGFDTVSSSAPMQAWGWADIKRVAGEVQSGQLDSVPESWIVRANAGVAGRVDRTKASGNMQVPAVVRAAWNILND